jgi:predicted esterase
VQRAVLIAPFTSLRDMAARLFTRPAALLLLESYDNRQRLRELAERPTPPRIAIFHGTGDALIPPDMGRELAETFPQMIEFFPIDRATHDTVVGDAMEQILAWMNR